MPQGFETRAGRIMIRLGDKLAQNGLASPKLSSEVMRQERFTKCASCTANALELEPP